MTAEDEIAKELRAEMDARLNSYKAERAQLLLAPKRISELDELIKFIEDDPQTVKVLPRPKGEAGKELPENFP